jgi:hypothetical protein
VPGTCATPDASNGPPLKGITDADGLAPDERGGGQAPPASRTTAATAHAKSNNIPTTGKVVFTL